MAKRAYGQVLVVDLTDRSFRTLELEPDLLRKFVGGAGLAAYLYHMLVPRDVPPLDPSSPLIVMSGPLTGTPSPLSGRHVYGGRSPLTGFWGHASVGGHWGLEMRQAGFDGLVIIGRAEAPAYLLLQDEKVEIRNAGSIWGLDTFVTEGTLKNELGAKAKVCTIGPAGENLVKYAGIFTDGVHARAAGRCGLGALMGSKNLKAIVVQGTQELPIEHKDALRRNVRELLPSLMEKLKGMSDFGTPGLVVPCEAMGDLPIRNWTRGKWAEGVKKLSGQEINEKHLKGRFHCAGCVVGCGRIVGGSLETDLTETGGPEYETLAMLGSNCLVDDLPSILRLNELVNRLGLDSIETGAIVAFCMELYERGLIGQKELGSIDLRWGNGRASEALIRMVASRQGFGDLLAEGLQKTAEEIGGTAIEYAIQSNNMALPAHDPRAYSSIALGYSTSSRGPCHTDCFSHIFERAATFPEIGIEKPLDRFASDGKAAMVVDAQHVMHLWENLALCKFNIFGGIRLHHISDWLKYVAGWEMGPEELLEVGERSFNLKRMLNVQWGWSRKNDTLPLRVLTHRASDGGAGDHLPPLNIMIADYYRQRGWSEEGIPTDELLGKLGLRNQ